MTSDEDAKSNDSNDKNDKNDDRGLTANTKIDVSKEVEKRECNDINHRQSSGQGMDTFGGVADEKWQEPRTVRPWKRFGHKLSATYFNVFLTFCILIVACFCRKFETDRWL